MTNFTIDPNTGVITATGLTIGKQTLTVTVSNSQGYDTGQFTFDVEAAPGDFTGFGTTTPPISGMAGSTITINNPPVSAGAVSVVATSASGPITITGGQFVVPDNDELITITFTADNSGATEQIFFQAVPAAATSQHSWVVLDDGTVQGTYVPVGFPESAATNHTLQARPWGSTDVADYANTDGGPKAVNPRTSRVMADGDYQFRSWVGFGDNNRTPIVESGKISIGTQISITSVDVLPTSGQVGDTFSANVVVDGQTSPDLTYQWVLGGVDIPGATSAGYQSANPGALSVRVTATNTVSGVTDTQQSAAVTVNTVAQAPTITSVVVTPTSGQIGDTFSATVVAAGSPAPLLTYQWTLDSVDIPGATAAAYTTDAAGTLLCRATATNTAGTVSADSPGAAVAAGLSSPRNISRPAISTPALVGTPMTVTTGVWEGSPAPSYTYRWQVNTTGAYVNIPGATANAYTPVAADAGQRLRVQVTATNSEGSSTVSSPASPAIGTTDAESPVLSGGAISLLPDPDVVPYYSNEAGTPYWIIDANSTAAAAAVRAGTGTLAGSGLTDIDHSGLAVGVWWLHTIVEDAAGNLSNVVSTQFRKGV